MEPQFSRIFKVCIQLQERNEVFYCRAPLPYGYVWTLENLILTRYPSLKGNIKRTYVKDKKDQEFTIMNKDDLIIFLEADEFFENEIIVELNGVSRNEIVKESVPTDEQKVKISVMTIHKNIICDCCDKAIEGFRYKCMECHDFNLCMKCESKMRHKEHKMIRIPEPENLNSSNLKFGKDRMSKDNNDNNAKDERQHNYNRHYHHLGKHGPGIFTNIFTYMHDLADANERTTSNERTTFNEPTTSNENNKKKESPTSFPQNAAKQAESKSTPTENKSEKEGHIYHEIEMDAQKLGSVGIDVLNYLSKTVSTLLDPIRVSVEVESRSKSSKQAKTSEQTSNKPDNGDKQSAPQDETVNKAEKSNVPTENLVEVDSASNSEDCNCKSYGSDDSNRASPEIEIGWTVIDQTENDNNVSDNQNTETIPKTNKKENTNSDEPSSSTKNSSSAAETGKSIFVTSPISTPADFEQLGRDLKKHIDEDIVAGSTQTQTTEPIAPIPPVILQPTFIQPEPIVYHYKPHINHAVHIMMNMGFSNEGGWLSKLLETVDGDIPRCFELMTPKK